jgi:hypothetical protein
MNHSMFCFIAYGGCAAEFMANSDGQMATQLLANADVAGQDGQASLLLCRTLPSLNGLL